MAVSDNQSGDEGMGSWLPSVETVAYWSFLVSIFTGAIALAAGAVSTVAGNQAAAKAERVASVRIQEAGARAEEAKLETEKLRGLLQDRRLTQAQIEALVDSLKGKGLEQVDVLSDRHNVESTALRDQFVTAFKTAGYESGGGGGINRSALGVGISIPFGEEAKREILSSALESARIPFFWYDPVPKGQGALSNRIALIVGAKPSALQEQEIRDGIR